MPMVGELIRPLYWVRDDLSSANTYRQDLNYNAWPGVEWYSLRSGDVVPFPEQRISAETVITRQDNWKWSVRTVRVNTTGPNFRRGATDLTYTQACDLAVEYRNLHERYVLGRLGTRHADADVRYEYTGTPPFTIHADEDLSATDEDAIARTLGEEVTPRCDYCNMTEDDTPQLHWDGDEGMHEECIAPLRQAMGRLVGNPDARLHRDSVPMPEPDRPRLSSIVPDAHEGWFV